MKRDSIINKIAQFADSKADSVEDARPGRLFRKAFNPLRETLAALVDKKGEEERQIF